jgi:hypothetical protein
VPQIHRSQTPAYSFEKLLLASRESSGSVSSDREQRLEGGGLSVRFHRREDRFAHEIWLADRGNWIQALSSREGLPLDEWPPSPPFQSLNVESRAGDRQVALLVGMASSSHWSASVELDPAAGCVTFDVACRTRQQGPLGSCYHTLLPLADRQASRAIFASREALAARLKLELCEQHGRAQLELSGELLRVGAIPDSTIEAAWTVRWSYTISLRYPSPTA